MGGSIGEPVVSLEEDRRSMVVRLRSRWGEIGEALLARVHDVASDPAGSGDVQYDEGQRAAVVAVLDYALTCIEHGEERATLIPSAAVAQVHRAARSGVAVSTVVRRYMAAHAELGDFVTQEAARGGLTGDGAALRSVQRTQALLLDRLLVTVNEEYAREVERLHRSPEQRLAERVRRLLAGGIAEAVELGYQLEGSHVGVIATGLGAGQAVRGVAARLSCRLLLVPQDERSVWAWLGGSREAVVCVVERLSAATWPAGVSLALGDVEDGLAGWRATHGQAQDALLVSRHQPQTLMRYSDAALLAPFLHDEARARKLVEMYLVPLDHQHCSGKKLRETLRAYFDARQQVASTAARLGVSRQTVASRLCTVERALDRPLDECQTDLHIALRLEELGGPRDVPGGP
jgi:PucR C-terminal helix-turn-helix domain/GGDEF-like domain